jgi:Ser/Thr protein kinase RdoA (MazF antagonist)
MLPVIMKDRELEQIAILFGGHARDARRLRSGNYHASFEIDPVGKPRILRLSPAGEDPVRLEDAMRRLAGLARLGAPVVRPLPSHRGVFAEPVTYHGRSSVATVMEKATGASHERLTESDLGDRGFTGIGRALARLHAAMETLLEADSGLPVWHEHASCFRLADPDGSGAGPLLDAYRKYFGICRSFGEGGPGWGIIHGDLHFDNLIVDPAGRGATFCDFDDCCRGWRAMDLAMLAFDLGVILDCRDRPAAVAHRRDVIVAGYREEGAIREAELAMLPPFLKLLEVSLYLQFRQHLEGAAPESWLGRFFVGREERILEDVPYL